jgi:hypothetical protein
MGTHDEMIGHVNCIASIGKSALCSHQDTLAMATLHSDFFQILTSAIILITMLAFSWTLPKDIPTVKERIVKKIFIQRADLIFEKTHQPFLSWMSLHEQVA